MKERKKLNKLSFRKYLIVFVVFVIQFIPVSLANGDDNNDIVDLAGKFGWAAVGLIFLVIIYVFFYQLFLKSRKILPKNDKFDKRMNKIKNLYIKVKKPLSFLHYFAALTVVIILLFHGVPLIGNEAEKVIPGLVAGISYFFYVILGILIKVVLRKSKKGLKLRKFLFKFHTQLMILILVGLITIVHLAISA